MPLPCATVGSETAVSVISAQDATFAGDDNKMCGFGWFKNGFTLQDNTTTCSFDSVYPVSGDVDFNGGTLYLNQDLTFKNITTIGSLGKVDGNGYLLDLCSSIGVLPAQSAEFTDVKVAFHADLMINDTVTLKGNCAIRGNGYDLDFGANGTIVIDSNTTAHFTDLTLEGILSNNVVLTDDTSKIVLENVKWKQSADVTFSKGSILFLNNVDFIGTHSFTYDSNQTSTISDHSSFSLTEGMSLEIGRKELSDVEPLYFADDTSVLKLDSCSFIVTEHGMNLTNGKIEVDKDVNLEMVGTDTSTGLVLGNGSQGDDFIVHLNSGASLRFKTGQLMYNNYANNCVTSLSENARIVRYGPSKVYVARDWIFPPMVLKVDSGVPTTTIKDGVRFGYEEAKLIFDDVEYGFSGGQSGSYNFFLNNNDFISLYKGTFLTPLLVLGTGNRIYGSGTFSGPIILQDTNTEVSCNLNGLILGGVTLNGGTVTLAGDVYFGGDGVFAGEGAVDISEYNCNLSSLDSLWSSTVLWKSNGGAITLHANTALSGRWEFEDSCIIQGNRHVLDLGDTGCIVIKDGAEVTLRDVIVHMLSEDDIQFITDSSKLILDNVKWIQDTNFTLSKGSLTFINDVDFVGPYTFCYDSNQTSTIAANAKWTIGDGMTFKMGKKPEEGAVEPLCFEEATSGLELCNCSFEVTGSGLRFTKGKVHLDRKVNLTIEGTTPQTGLVLGDGTEENDISVCMHSGLGLHFLAGQLVHNNYANNKFSALSESACIIRYGPSKMYMATNLLFPSMGLKVASGAPITEPAEGVIFNYDKSRLVFDNVEFEFKGRQDQSSVFLLEGDSDFLYLTKGSFVLPFFVSGVPNYIFGTGNVTGGITLQDADTQLIFDLNGTVWSNIDLNDSTLTLGGDLCLGADTILSGSGKVQLMRYYLTLGSQDACWTSTIAWQSNGLGHCPCSTCSRGINLNARICLSGTWLFEDTTIVNGNGNVIDLEKTGRIVVGEGTKLTIRDVTLHIKHSDAIKCLEDNSSLILDNVTWIQDDDVIFDKGSIKVVNEVDFVGSYSFVYDSNQMSTITQDSKWCVTSGMKFCIGRKEADVEPLCFEDSTSTLKFDNSSFIITGSGMNLTVGKVEVDRDVDLCIEGTLIANGLVLGDGQQDHDVIVVANSGASMHMRSGQLVYNNYASDCIVALSESARFLRYGPSKVYVANNWSFPNMTLKVVSGFPETVIADGKSFGYNGCHLIFDIVEFDYVGRQFYSSVFSLAGNDSLYINKGNFLLPLFVSGTGNIVRGTGAFGGGIQLQDSDTELILDFNGNIQTSIAMNGGKVILSDDLSLICGVMFLGDGIVNLGYKKLTLGIEDLTWAGSTRWENGAIDIRSKVDLTSTWTFSGRCLIDGHGNTIDLSDTGNIVIDEGAMVIFRDVKLTGITDKNITCLDDAGLIMLHNVSWVQSGDYTFDAGTLYIKDNVKMRGAHTFIYQTPMTSTVLADTLWKLDFGFTFSYDTNSKDLIAFEAESSQLCLNGAALHTTATGLRLRKGNLIVSRDSSLSSETYTYYDELEEEDVTVDGGITLGDGTLDNDFSCQILSGVCLSVSQGSLNYKNVSASSWCLNNIISSLFIGEDVTLNLYQNLNLGEGSIIFGDNAILGQAEGKDVTGALRPQGQLLYTNI